MSFFCLLFKSSSWGPVRPNNIQSAVLHSLDLEVFRIFLTWPDLKVVLVAKPDV